MFRAFEFSNPLLPI